MTSYILVRDIFLRSVAVIYLIAFASYYVQYPGLFGCDGLAPASRFILHLRNAFPTDYLTRLPSLAWVYQLFAVPVDTVMELMAVCGAITALLAAVVAPIAPLYFVMWALYLSLSKLARRSFIFRHVLVHIRLN